MLDVVVRDIDQDRVLTGGHNLLLGSAAHLWLPPPPLASLKTQGGRHTTQLTIVIIVLQ